MPIRRSADPLHVQHVWDGIKCAAQKRQIADFAHLSKYIQKFANCTQPQAELYIKQTLEDGLIVEVRKISQKGPNLGNEVESYKINKSLDNELQAPPDDGHDWYCIECHLAGNVSLCGKCYRVFHTECSTNARHKHTLFPKKNHINRESISSTPPGKDLSSSSNSASTSDIVIDLEGTDSCKSNSTVALDVVSKPERNSVDYIYDEALCSICNIAESDPGSGLNEDELNYVLNFVLLRIKSWVPEQLTSTLSAEPKYEWLIPAELRWRAGQLFYQHMDMSVVDMKIRTKEFSNFTDFQADVITMLHNVAIFHGVESQEFGAAELMLRDMKYDISELQNCVDCYKHSNEKVNNKWFCLPCRIPHNLVWAKQKGYPHWPAKVIRETDTSCDVRFFGGKYERSILPKICIKPISTPYSQLSIKKTATFNKAVEELQLHQRLIQNPTEVMKILSTPAKKSGKKSKSRQTLNNTIKTPKSTNKVTAPVRETNVSDDIYEFQDSPTMATTPKELIRQKRKISSEAPEIVPKKKTVPIKGKLPGREDVIQISDVEDERDFDFSQENCEFSDSGVEQVTSSTELVREDVFMTRGNTEGVMQKLDQPYSDAVEKMRRKLELCKNKNSLIRMAMDSMQAETDKLTNDHHETLKRLFETHNSQISETKKKQWCFNCEQDAIYHCCWNTAYCSPTCQQQHWQAEHKKVCRRKR